MQNISRETRRGKDHPDLQLLPRSLSPNLFFLNPSSFFFHDRLAVSSPSSAATYTVYPVGIQLTKNQSVVLLLSREMIKERNRMKERKDTSRF